MDATENASQRAASAASPFIAASSSVRVHAFPSAAPKSDRQVAHQQPGREPSVAGAWLSMRRSSSIHRNPGRMPA